jgi:hypothetical protein
MKHKLTQKEWNDKRDAFLCAIIQGSIIRDGNYGFNGAIDVTNTLTSRLYEVEDHNVDTNEKVDHVPDVGKKAEYTRPFNPKVVEIFNEYLPKEIAPLAIEAHKRSCEIDESWLNGGYDLNSSLHGGIHWEKNECLGSFFKLTKATTKNTITATPEQLREWFPLAYQNELVMLVKENYLAADGLIKKAILKDGVWYAPANDLYKNEGGQNE